jgi:hypothetical protein
MYMEEQFSVSDPPLPSDRALARQLPRAGVD